MKNKVAILTITHGQNYGNRLQNYAVQTVLERFDLQVETIRNTTKTFNTRTLNYRLKLFIKRLTGYQLEQLDIRRYKFDKFTDKYIKLSKYEVAVGNIPNDLKCKYDLFVSGSDQVWNPHYGCNSHIDFMTFADKKQRISYAASFGIEELPEGSRSTYAEWIKGLNHISVREGSGARIIKELTGRDATILVDPTMMLSANEWEKIESKPKFLDESKKFILAYFLGDIESDKQKYVKKVADELEYEIIYLYNDTNEDENARNDKSFAYDPSEFLWLIHHAKIVFTDSFHACVFSILYNTPFRVFERTEKENLKMGSRIQNLLDIFGLKSCYGNISEELECIVDDNYDVTEILEEERKRTMGYLSTALKIK